MTKIYQGVVGLEIRLDTCQDLAGATSMKIMVQKPDGAEAEWMAAQYNSTMIYYVTVDGDLAESGNYILQSSVEWGNASRHLGESVMLKVYRPYE
ncbi:MAG: hypothetical protein A4E48_00025 [Methanosaeta sp. PtaU1.Bin060]|nr:hypothetical protein [Candidatus Methanosuratincola sp.]MDM7913622.1 hypothetical protein [Methanotrichaceae archaeon]OPY55498.1 MAG: hypothetical protein A4E48_00025 [Methanosaeta sp. PtaU1.Bin060]